MTRLKKRLEELSTNLSKNGKQFQTYFFRVSNSRERIGEQGTLHSAEGKVVIFIKVKGTHVSFSPDLSYAIKCFLLSIQLNKKDYEHDNLRNRIPQRT